MAGIEDTFPEGLRVLVVDDNITCLRVLELLLQRCKYDVTVTQEAAKALKMLMENPKKYDIVISDVHMPGMDGFQLLENIGIHMDIPVIMLSANDDYAQIMRGIKHGAVDYLTKPVRLEELKNIWQHVVRRKYQDEKKGKAITDNKKEARADQSKDGKSGTSLEQERELETQKRKNKGDDGDEEDGLRSNNHGPSSSKRQRVVWSPKLHKKFVNVVDQLGHDNASPKKILDVMNVEGLTRENVASHLQKYRFYMKRMTHMRTMGPSVDPTLIPFGAHDPSLFHSGGAIFNPYGPFTNLEPSLSNSSMGLTISFHPNTTNGVVLERMTDHASIPGGYTTGIPSANQLQMNSTQVIIDEPSLHGVDGLPIQPTLPAQYSGYRPQSSIPSLQDYARYKENWQNNTVTHATTHSQALPTDFNGGVYSTEISHLQNAFESTSIDVPAIAQNRRFNTLELQEYGDDLANLVNTSNGGDQSNQWFGESRSNPYGIFPNSTYGRVAGNDASSGLEDTEAQVREADAMLNLDENYSLDEPDLLVEFHENDNGFLSNIVERLLD